MNKKLSLITSMILSSALLLAGCGTTAASSGSGSASTSASDDFKTQVMFNGSSTIAPILSSVSTTYIEDNVTWNKIDSSFPEKNIAIYVSSGGSGAGVKSVIEGTADFGMVSRKVKDEEKAKIKDYKEYQIGYDALTISINKDNPLASLKDDISTDDLKKIFSGEYKYWSDFDASLPHEEIVCVTRDIGGGAHEVFQNNVMGDTDVKSDVIQAPSMGALATKIIENKYAIGYASLGMYTQNKDKLVALKVDGVEPTVDNIMNGSYKIQRPLLLIHSGDPSPSEQKFLDYVMSDNGKKVVESNGYIPVK